MSVGGTLRGGVGWYVHHHGSGHLTRAAVVARALDLPVTVLSSTPRPAALEPFADWVELAPDWVELAPDWDEAGHPPPVGDPTGRGVFHWVPERHPGLRSRMARLASWVEQAGPAVMVVDVSVEVVTLARLLGVPVVSAVLPGARVDEPHLLAHRIADALLAPWPDELMETAHLAPFRDRLHGVGGLSRFTGRMRVADPEPGRVLLLAGSGGTDTPTGVQPWEDPALTPGWRWRRLGGGGDWVDDPWAELCRAEVVVCQAGQNAVADAAAAGARVVAVPQLRPFGEQHALTRALAEAGLAVGLDGWPEPQQWPAILERARALDPDWTRWRLDGAAERAAAVITEVAGGTP